MQRKQLAEGVAAGAAQHQIGHSQGIRHFGREELLLAIALLIQQAFVQIALAAQMEHIHLGQQIGQGFPQALVDALSAQTAAGHQQHRLLAVKASHGKASRPAALKQFRTQRRTGIHALLPPRLGAFREGGGHLGGKLGTDAVGKARGQVAFVADSGHTAQPRADDHRHADEAALGEAHIGLQFAHQPDGLERAPDDPERIGKVLQAEIAAQFAAFHRVIGDARNLGDHLVLDAVFRADVMNIIAHFLQAGNQAQVGRHMTGSTAARQNDSLAHPMYLPLAAAFGAPALYGIVYHSGVGSVQVNRIQMKMCK